MKYDFCVVITTFNRKEPLKLLLDDIFTLGKEYNLFVVVFDDGSSDVYDYINDYPVKYIKYVKNNGLKNVWRIIGQTFNFCKKIESEYFVYLQDDLRLKDNFFSEAVRIYEKIDDDRKISLGTLTIESQKNSPKWTNIEPVFFDDYIKSQWCELVFICKKNFMEVLDYRIDPIPSNRWDRNPNLSCGVGEQISRRLLNKRYNMYHTLDTLTTHGDHESKFYPEFRKTEKLIAK
jgi:glycosyltransferase involved in cell wall biosynthesis